MSITRTSNRPAILPRVLLLVSVMVVSACGGGGGGDEPPPQPTRTNSPPTANAGADATVNAGEAVTLNGSGTDPENTTLSYAWRLIDNAARVTLSNAAVSTPTFTAPAVAQNTTLTFEITVTDAGGLTATDRVAITVNAPPEARAGERQTVASNTLATLNGSASTDPGGGDIEYLWRQAGEGPTVTLSDATVAAPTFTTPIVTQDITLVFELTVTDESGLTDTSQVTITVNALLVSDVEPQQIVDPNAEVVLDTQAALDDLTDIDPNNGDIEYLWRQIGEGTRITLSDATAAAPTFTAPAVTRDTILAFELTVTEPSGESYATTVFITINAPPEARAGEQQTVAPGAEVTLDGSGSFDPDGNVLTYAWSQPSGQNIALSSASDVMPTFTVPDLMEDAELLFTLTVSANGATSRDTVTVTVDVQLTARAGADQTVAPNAVVTLNGSGSFDPDGNTLTYAWSQPSGQNIALSSASDVMPTFTVPDLMEDAELVFTLTVSANGTSSRDTATVAVDVQLTARAGVDQTVAAGDTVTLNGSDSFDPDGGVPTYAWSQPLVQNITLSDDAIAAPTFVAPIARSDITLTFRLTVADANGLTDTDEVTITIEAQLTALAGPDQTVAPNAVVTLDGSGSFDPDGNALTHAWSQPSGQNIALSSTSDAMPTFTTPDLMADAELVFTLTVRANGASTRDTVTVTVDVQLTARAGADQTVAPNAVVTLDGSGSFDPDGNALTHAWSQPSGQNIALSSTSDAMPTFTTSDLMEDAELVFTLTVRANGASARDTVTVTVDVQLTARAGADQTAAPNTVVTLNGSGSFDPDGNALTYAWSQPSGQNIALSSTGDVMPTFTTPDLMADAELVFTLTVSANGATARDTVTVTVDVQLTARAGADQTAAPNAEVTLDGSGSFDPDGNALTHAWSQPSGQNIALSSASDAMPTFTTSDLMEDTQFVFTLTVSANGASSQDTVTVTVDVQLTARAGADQTAAPNAEVTLDGSGSFDPDGNTLTYAWSQPSGQTIALSSTSDVMPTFTTPDLMADAELVFTLTVSANGASSRDTVTVTVDVQLTARAGADQTVAPNAEVTLDGSGSFDPDGNALTYAWSQPSGQTIALSSASDVMPTFTTPDLMEDTQLVFTLAVSANGATAQDTVTIAVDVQLTARAGADQTVAPGTVVTLDGSGSFDPDGGVLTHAWSQPSGQDVTLSSAGDIMPTFTAPTPETIQDASLTFTFTFTLTITDTSTQTAQDGVTVHVSATGLFTMEDHVGTVRGVSISRDGSLAVSGGLDGTVRLWNASTGTPTHVLGNHDGPVYAVAINADGTRAISGGGDGTVRLWTWNEDGGSEVLYESDTRSLGAKGVWVYAVALNRDGTRAASGGFDGTVRVWNTDATDTTDDDDNVYGEEITFDDPDTTETETNSLGGHGQHSVYGVSLSDDGSRVLSGGADGTVRLWNSGTGAEAASLTDDDGPMGVVFGVSLAGDGSVAAAGSADNNVHVWSIATDGTGTVTATETHELTGHAADVSSVALNQAKTRVLSAGGDGTVRLWNVDASDTGNNGAVRTLRQHTDYAWSASLSGSGAVALSGGGDGTLRLWNTTVQPADTAETFATAESNRDATATNDVRLLALTGGTALGSIASVSLSADGRFAMSGSPDKTVRLWNAATGAYIRHMGDAGASHGARVWAVALSANGDFALSGAAGPRSSAGETVGNDVRLWDTTTGNLLRTMGEAAMTGHTDNVNSVSLSADGRLALSGGKDKTMRLWDASTGVLRYSRDAVFAAFDDVWSVALSTDGSRALSGGADRTMRLWDAVNGSQIGDYVRNIGVRLVRSVALSADGSRALWGDGSGRVRSAVVGTELGTPITMGGDIRHSSDARGTSLSADGRLALSGGDDQNVRLWNAATGELLRTMDDHTSTVNGVALSADGRLALSGGADQNVYLWRLGRSDDTFVPTTAEASAGEDRAVAVATEVTLDGSGSIDSRTENGKPIAYYWRQTAGTDVTLSANDTETVTFTTPTLQLDDTLVFELAVTDARGLVDTDAVSITIDVLLTAFASTVQTASPGDTVTLDGSDSFDPDGGELTYSWSQPPGQNIVLSDADSAMPTFIVPTPTTIRGAAPTFTLTVTASGTTAQTTVSVQVDGDHGLFTMENHEAAVRGVSISRDGSRAVSGGTDGAVRLWDTTTGTAIHTLGSHDGPVFAVAINADGTRAISGGVDGTVRLWTWDEDGGSEVLYDDGASGTRSLGAAGIWVYAVALNKDGSRAASGGFDGTVRVWNTAMSGAGAGSEITYDDTSTMETETDSLGSHGAHSVYGVSLSDDGNHVLSGGADGTVRLWNAGNGEEVISLADGDTIGDGGPMGAVFGVSLAGDGSVAAAGGADNNVHVWSIAIDTGTVTATEVHEFTGHAADVSSVSLNEAKTRVLSAGGDGTVRFWNVDAGDANNNGAIRTLRQHTDYAWSASLSGDGFVALSGGSDDKLHLWNTATQQADTVETFVTTEQNRDPASPGDVRTEQLPGLARITANVSDVSLSADGRFAASGSTGQQVRLWDAVTRSHLRNMNQGGVVNDVALNADGRLVLSGSSRPGGTVRLWDAATGNRLHQEDYNANINGVALSPDGRLALSGSDDKKARLWDTSTGNALATMSGHSGRVFDVSLSADGGRALSGGSDNSVRLWDTATGNLLRTMGEGTANGHTQWVLGVALSTDGRFILSGSWDHTLRLWDATTGSLLRTMDHGDDINDVALSTDGRLALSGSDDDTVRLWDATNGNLLRTMTGHTANVYGVSLSADGRLALSGGEDRSTRLWYFGRSNETFVRTAAMADAGADQTVASGSVVTLDGSCSSDLRGTATLDGCSDPEAADKNKPIAYFWRQTAVSGTSLSAADTVTLSANNAATATFTAPTATSNTTLLFALTVTDARGLVDTDEVTITVTPTASGSGAPRLLTGDAPRNRSTPTSNAPDPSPTWGGSRSGPATVSVSNTMPDASPACARAIDRSGRAAGGRRHGPHCIYPASAFGANNPLETDMAIPALPNGGAHIFRAGLVVGNGHAADANRDGPTLTIEAGTTLAFEGASSTLIINPSSRLLATGTPDKPIILTSRGDAEDSAQAGQWGGLKIYGGINHGNTSGRLEYVVVKHAAANAGTSDGGGIELRDVASGTVVRNLQAYASPGDGLAIVGGAVRVENFVAVHVQGDSVDIDGDWSGSLTNALVIQSEHGGDHCLNIHGPHQGDTNAPASGQIAGLTCITSPHTAGAKNLGTGIRLGANAGVTIERSLVVGTFADDTDPRTNYCLRLDNHAPQPESDESLAPNAPVLTGNVFACEDKTGGSTVEAWVADGNNQFADVEAPTDPTTATDTHLQLLGGTPPVYSLDYDELQVNGADTTVTPPNGTDFPGAASQSAAPSWLRPGGIDWTYGIFEGNRDERLWFDTAQ